MPARHCLSLRNGARVPVISPLVLIIPTPEVDFLVSRQPAQVAAFAAYGHEQHFTLKHVSPFYRKGWIGTIAAFDHCSFSSRRPENIVPELHSLLRIPPTFPPEAGKNIRLGPGSVRICTRTEEGVLRKSAGSCILVLYIVHPFHIGNCPLCYFLPIFGRKIMQMYLSASSEP